MAELRIPTKIPTEPLKQVVFVHGLRGDKDSTWTLPKGWKVWQQDVFWPEWLAEDIPGTAVWSLGYGASATYWKSNGAAMALPDRAANALPTLVSALSDTEGDIILVGYSLGGLVVNATLRRAETLAPHDAKIANFFRRVRGIVQLGTPNAGAGLATLGTNPIASLVVRPRETLDDLPRDGAYLRDLNGWFRAYVPSNEVSALVITERQPQGLAGLIVQPSSADPGLPPSAQVVPVDESHSSLAQPKSRESDVYRLIVNFVSSPLAGPHPDTLHAQGMQEVEEAVRDVQASIQENTTKLHDIGQGLDGLAFNSSVVTHEAEERLTRLRQGRLIPGFDAEAESRILLREVDTGELTAASSSVRQSAFAWCARILSGKDFVTAQAALDKAEAYGITDEIIITQAFIQAYAPQKDKSGALASLDTLKTPASFSASLMIVAADQEPSVPLSWLNSTGLTVDAFDSDGKLRIIGIHLGLHDWATALEIVEGLTASDFSACPGLLFVAAVVYVGQTVHADLRAELELPVPENLSGFPLSDDPASLDLRRKAIDLYKRAATTYAGLHAEAALALTSDRALWLELRDPTSKEDALKRLQDSMAEDRVRLRRIPFALSFGLDLNLQAVEQDIERATALSGGASIEAAVARFAVALHRKANDVPDYIEKHREQIIKYYNPEYVDAIAIEGLARAGRFKEANIKLAALTQSDVDPKTTSKLQEMVDVAASGNAATRLESDYDAAPTAPALINLVNEFKQSRNFPKLAHYAEILFSELKDSNSAETFVQALYQIGGNQKIVALAEDQPEIVASSDKIKSTLAWAFYRLGEVNKAAALLKELRASRNDENYRYLARNIAIASGDWASLGTFVEAEWDERADREPKELLRAGVLAQRIGSARSKELVREAAKKADGDAHVLAMCYETAASSGWEDDEEIHKWLAIAIENSGENGPIQVADIRELIDRQPTWNEQVDRTWEMLVRGDVPMFAAGQVVNRTLLELFIRPALQNLKEVDARRKSPIFAFAGTRPIQNVAGKRLALDLTSLLTLTVAGHTRRVMDWCENLTIPHTTLGWLFEERSKLAFHQPSQVRHARKVKKLIDEGNLHRFEGGTPLPTVEHKVGEDTALYLAAAQTLDSEDTAQKIIVRPYPLPKAGSLLEEKADISGFEDHFAGCSDVLDALKRSGHLTDTEQSNALAYLQLHEEPWPHKPSVLERATLYLDHLAVSYFLHLNLLPRLAQAGFKVFVTSSEAQRASELMRIDDSGAEARELVESLQIVLRDGIASGKVKLGRLVPGEDSDERFNSHPTRMMISDQLDVDAIVVDDRFLNKHVTMGVTTPVVTSIDVLSSLVHDGIITPADFAEAMTHFRLAGMTFVPHRTGEIENLLSATPLANNNLLESAELRAISESITRARMTDALQLPQESFWMDSLIRELLYAIRAQWNDQIPDDLARARSTWAMGLLDVRGWGHRGKSTGITAVERYRAQIMSLLLLPGATDEVRARYWSWLDDIALRNLKEEDSESYQKLLENVQDVVTRQVDQGIESGELDLRGQLALELLKIFPSSIGNDIANRSEFRTAVGYKPDATITFNRSKLSFRRSVLFPAIRAAYIAPEKSVAVETEDGRQAALTIEVGEKPKLFISIGDQRDQIPAFWMLADDPKVRLTYFLEEVENLNLPSEVIAEWKRRIEDRNLTDEEVEELTSIQKTTPEEVAAAIKSEFSHSRGRISILVPTVAEYYINLIGERGDALNIENYAAGNAKAQIDRLIKWDFKRGLAQCLLFCANPRLTACIDISGQPVEDVDKFFHWLKEEGDRFSQIAGIEVGIRSLAEYPSIEPLLLKMLEEIRDEDTSSASSRLAISSSLFVLVDGELARRRSLPDAPPYWRRLASTAQSSMIARTLISLSAVNGETAGWSSLRGEQFFMQTYADLRLEPRWIPDFIEPNQLRLDMLMRARIVELEANVNLPEGSLRSLILEDLAEITSVPSACAPSPIEGGIASPVPFPDDLLTELRKPQSDKPAEAHIFAGVVKFAFVFRFDQEIADLVVRLLRKVKYRLNLSEGTSISFNLLMGLAAVAATTRHKELADEVRILTRVLRRRGNITAEPEIHMRIALLACASHVDLQAWCNAVGSWLFEIANEDMNKEDAARLHSHIRSLCVSVPALWEHIAKTNAALALASR